MSRTIAGRLLLLAAMLGVATWTVHKIPFTDPMLNSLGYVEVKSLFPSSETDMYFINNEQLRANGFGKIDAFLLEKPGVVLLTLEREGRRYSLCSSKVIENSITSILLEIKDNAISCSEVS